MYGTTLFVCVIAAFAFVIVEGRSVSSDVPAEGKCEPGKSYKVDCNTCVCGDSGVLACTLALCLDKRSAASDELKEPCTNGTHKVIGDGCNYCSCTPELKWACIDGDINKCVKGTQKTKRDAECAYGETKHIDCNSCSCTKNGYWACTRMACISGGLNDASSGETGGVYRV
ncbi:uncharacterized protein LOC108744093 isoform X1 [Agrilus planipennis]|uniref:Uncharacterized protein LOC108744093 isoform X1 n=1 Tax=Agrilus planipennis TaxID=224129 RepID=A0A7F5R377_AGRPL|nr:uncharacterized protein LOC108744093 isoform X1 [Agrilus planipennis]